MTTQEAFAQWANKMGIIEKAEGGIVDISTVNFGGIIPQPLIERLISLTRSQSQWLGAIDTRVRGRSSGEIPIVDWNEPATEHVGRNGGTKLTTRPPTRMVPYATKKFKSEYYITTEELREATQAGISNFESRMMTDWATQLGNDIAGAVMNSNASLDTSSRMNRLLRAFNGVDIQTDAGANVFDAEGKAFGQGIFAAMLDFMPDRFANDGGLRWMFNRRVNTQWNNSLTNVNTTERMRSVLGDRALTTEIMVPPLGISQLIVPQIAHNKGPAALAPTSATASGSGIEFVLTTMISASQIASVALGVGRRIKVTYLPSGMSETVKAYDDTTLKILTLGKLGQDTVSTNASDYLVQIADETDLYLCNPKGIALIYTNDWRSYREFNKDFDRYEVTTYFEIDVLVAIPETMVKFKRVRVSPIETWT